MNSEDIDFEKDSNYSKFSWKVIEVRLIIVFLETQKLGFI